MPEQPGYSGTPLPKKLGLKDGQRALFVGLPDHLSSLRQSANFASCREDRVSAATYPERDLDCVLVFVTAAQALTDALAALRPAIQLNGMIWVAWPKKSSKILTDVTEDVIRAMALERGLVDVKVCAVDGTWSGLKLVIPKSLRI